MPVNGGAGNSILFSEIQTFYGGTNPIRLSEYYRGGSEVPSTQTITTTETGSGNGSGSEDSITVTVTNADTQSVGGLTALTNQPGTQANYSTSSLSYLRLRVAGMGNHTVVFNGTQIFSHSQDDTNPFEVAYRGPTYQSGDGGVSASATLLGSGTLTWSGFSTSGDYTFLGTRSVSNVSRRTFTFTNNTGSTINMTATGNGTSASNSSLANGSSITISNVSGSGEGWSFTYTIQSTENTNTNIPTSGNVTLDDYNNPGNPAG